MCRKFTSLSNSFTRRVICFNTDLGANSEILTRKAATDFGPLLSLLLNSFPLRSLDNQIAHNDIQPENLISKMRIVILFGKNLEKFCHGFGEMFIILQILHNGSLGS